MNPLDWDSDQFAVALFIFAVFLAVTLGMFALCAPHNVDYYYLGSSGNNTATCVYAHWTWHTDEKAFCSNNYQEALDMATKATTLLPKH